VKLPLCAVAEPSRPVLFSILQRIWMLCQTLLWCKSVHISL